MLDLITAKKIEEAYRTGGFFGIIVYGKQNIGKSSYMLKVMAELYAYNWDRVFKHVVFDLDQVVRVLEKSRKNRIKVIGWDDAGVHGHKYVYFRNREVVELIDDWLQVIKTGVAGLIVTTPSPEELMLPLRANPGMRLGAVRSIGGPYRMVAVYEPAYFPNRGFRYVKSYYDTFNVMLPDHVYKRYTEMRRKYYVEVEERLLSKVKERLASASAQPRGDDIHTYMPESSDKTIHVE